MSDPTLPSPRTGNTQWPDWNWSEQDLSGYPPYSQRVGSAVRAPHGESLILDDPDVLFTDGTIIVQVEVKHSIGPQAMPANILWSPIARMLMSPTRYRTEWLSHVSDMNYERHECLKRRDIRGARWAVLRAHYYSLPRSLLLIPVGFLLHQLRHWLGF